MGDPAAKRERREAADRRVGLEEDEEGRVMTESCVENECAEVGERECLSSPDVCSLMNVSNESGLLFIASTAGVPGGSGGKGRRGWLGGTRIARRGERVGERGEGEKVGEAMVNGGGEEGVEGEEREREGEGEDDDDEEEDEEEEATENACAPLSD